jgi:hypothetical protein
MDLSGPGIDVKLKERKKERKRYIMYIYRTVRSVREMEAESME